MGVSGRSLQVVPPCRSSHESSLAQSNKREAAEKRQGHRFMFEDRAGDDHGREAKPRRKADDKRQRFQPAGEQTPR